MASAELLSEMFSAMETVDRCVRQAIIDDLSGSADAFTEAEEKAAEAVRDAVCALDGPESGIEDLRAQLEHAQATADKWRAQLSSANPEDRVMARINTEEWDREVYAIAVKGVQAEADAGPLRDDLKRAQGNLRDAQQALLSYALAMAAPYEHPAAQGTTAYQTFRADLGHLVPVLLSGDVSHPEWPACVTLFDRIAVSSGLRTDHISEDIRRKAADQVLTDEMSRFSSGESEDIGSVMRQVQTVAVQHRIDHEASRQVTEVVRPEMAYQPLRNVRT